MTAFYDTSLDKNSVEDWIKLLLYSTGGDKEIMPKIFTRTRTLYTHTDILDYIVTEECGKENSDRLLGMQDKVAKAGLTGGRQGGGGIR